MSSQYRKIEYETQNGYGDLEKSLLYIQYNGTTDHIIIYDQYGNHLFTYDENSGFDMGKALTVALNDFEDERLLSISGAEFREIINKKKNKDNTNSDLSDLINEFGIKIKDLYIDGHKREGISIEQYITLLLLKHKWEIPDDMYNEIITNNSIIILSFEYPSEIYQPITYCTLMGSNMKNVIKDVKENINKYMNLTKEDKEKQSKFMVSIYNNVYRISDEIWKIVEKIENISSTEFYKFIKEKGIDIESENYSLAIQSLIMNKKIRAYYPNDSTEYYFQKI